MPGCTLLPTMTLEALKQQHRLIHHFLEISAANFPRKTALVHDTERVTYHDLNRMADGLASWLLGAGIQPGDRVVLLLVNSQEYVASYYGILKSGAVAVPLSTDIKPNSIIPLLEELEARFVITSYRFERMLQSIDWQGSGVSRLLIHRPKRDWGQSAIGVVPLEDILDAPNTVHLHVDVQPTDLAAIIYTSGSTAKPKGSMLSHDNIVANTFAICHYLKLSSDDIQMVVLPFFYVMGQSLLNTHMAVGGTVVINNKFAYPADVLNQMVTEQVTGFSGVPSTYALLLYRSPLRAYRDRLTSLRYCSQAGGHMSPQIKSDLRQALPKHTEIYIMYGATEASARLTYLEPCQLSVRPNSIGKPIPGVILRVMGTDNNEVPHGQWGEIVAQGPNIMTGYWRDPESTAAVLGASGYRTGDIGYMDADGFFYVSGRKDNILKVGGHRISTQEVEDALATTGLVIDSVVFGLPDPLLGHRLAALIAPKDEGCSANEILASLAALIPRYKFPAEVKLCRNLPQNASGKIDRGKCLKLFMNNK